MTEPLFAPGINAGITGKNGPNHRRLRRVALISAAMLAVGGAGAGVAWASIPDSGGVIHGCYKTDGLLDVGKGALRIIDVSRDQCRVGETSISWNQTGPVGPRGLTGAQGVPGIPGTNGAPGTNGRDGATGMNGAAGTNGRDGVSAAFIARQGNDFQPYNERSATVIVTLPLPQGLYSVFGKVVVENEDGSPQTETCSLSTGESATARLNGRDTNGTGITDALYTQVITVQDLLTVNTPSSVTLSCGGFSGGARLGKITAIQVSSLHG